MARVSPIQESFAAGEIDPRIQGRTSTDAYKAGLKQALNWHPLVQGPIRLREGSKFLTTVDPDNWVSGTVGVEGIRVFTFQRGINEDAIVEIGEDTITVRNSIDGGPIVGGVTGNLIPNADYTGWDRVSPGFPICPIGGVPNSTYDCNRDKDIAGSADPGRYTGQINSPHAQTNAGCPLLGISGAFNAGTPDARIGLITQSGPQPGPFPGGGDPVYIAGVSDGWHGPSWENAQSSPIIIPTGSELLLNEFVVKWNVGMGPFSDSLLGPLPYTDIAIRVDIGTAKGLADVFTTDIAISAINIFVETTLNFIPGAGNNNLYITLYIPWKGAAIVPDLHFSTVAFYIYAVTLNLGVLNWTAPLAGGSGTPVEFTSPYTAAQLECLQVCMDPGEQEMFLTHPEVETHRLRLAVGEWTLEPISTILLPTPFVPPSPNNWAPGNFPATCALHEGRLWLGGSPLDPATLWASRSGDYVDFGGAAPASKDDPLLFPLSNSGSIQSLSSRKELVILTDISEVVGTSQQGVIAFDDFAFPKQTDWGSNCIQPILVGRDMVFTSNSRTRVRTFADEGGTNFGWDGNELSLLAKDIFGFPVRRMIYLDEPAYQACFLLSNGTMGMATFFYPENVIGWWRFATAHNGNRLYGNENNPGLLNQFDNASQSTNQIMDITKVNTSQGAKLWMVINRVGFPGTQLPGHEILGFDTGLIPRLDSCVIRTVDPVTLTVPGIDHLTDQSINVVVAVIDPVSGEGPLWTKHPNITAIAGVSSPFESWAAGMEAYVGLFYANQFRLLPVEGVSQRGTAQVSKRRWNKVFARLNKSALPVIEGIRAKDRTPASLMGGGEPIISGDTTMVDLSSGEGDITILQDVPLQSEITALFGKLVSEEV